MFQKLQRCSEVAIFLTLADGFATGRLKLGVDPDFFPEGNRAGQQEELSSMRPYDQGPIATATKPIYFAHNSTINSLNI
jgi:hypothetical protein